MLLRVLCGLFGFVALVASACDSRPAYPLDDDVPTDGGRDDAAEDATSE